MKKAVFFGSAYTLPSFQEYKDAYRISFLLAQKGYIIFSGGGYGIMEASAKGAIEGGGTSIGVILKEKPLVSKYIHKTIEAVTLTERIQILTEHANISLIFPGGTGTLAELGIMWDLVFKGLAPDTQIGLYKDYWKPVISHIAHQPRYTQGDAESSIFFFQTPEDCFSFICN